MIDELKLAKGEARKKERALRSLSEAVTIFLGDLDKVMDGRLSGEALGRAIAKLSNQLDMCNDQIRFFSLGIDHAKDDKQKAYRRLLKKHRGIVSNAESHPVSPQTRDRVAQVLKERGFPQYQNKCGKQGCDRPGVHEVWGSLKYYACREHLAEIEALVDSE